LNLLIQNLNKISPVFIGNIKATPVSIAGSLSSVGNTGYYANSNLSSALANSGLNFNLTTGCRTNSNSSCNPNYCKPSPYTCSICSLDSSSCGEPLTRVSCHFNGNCVDLVPTGGYDDAIKKLNLVGLDVFNESKSGCGESSGPHLHVSIPGTFTPLNKSKECWSPVIP